MTVSQLDQLPGFIRLGGPDEDREIRKIYCCDLLSLAMARAPADCAWVTVMGNMNTVAVATLADAACIVLAENAAIPEECIPKPLTRGLRYTAAMNRYLKLRKGLMLCYETLLRPASALLSVPLRR